MKERIVIWLAWHIPEALRYWATVRSCAIATTGRYSNTNVVELTMMEMLQRIEYTKEVTHEKVHLAAPDATADAGTGEYLR